MDDLARRRVTAAYYAMIEQVDAAFGRILQGWRIGPGGHTI